MTEVESPQTEGARFSAHLMYTAACMYYLAEATQAEIAERLGTSRPTVSRLLSEARRRGMVRIEVVEPVDDETGALADRTAHVLGLDAVHLSSSATSGQFGTMLGPGLRSALSDIGLTAGDALLVSSGRMTYEAAQQALPSMPGVLVVPMIGGQDEPVAWYQSNEIARQFAERISGTPVFLYAPAMPGPDLSQALRDDPAITRVLSLWETAKCAVIGVGAPPLLRESIPGFVPMDAISLRQAVGDVVSRFYDRNGEPVNFPGVERLVATPLEALRNIPVCIAVAAGQAKVPAIIAGARGSYYNQLVTDPSTAAAIVAACTEGGAR